MVAPGYASKWLSNITRVSILKLIWLFGGFGNIEMVVFLRGAHLVLI
jgi:hypothetical protein